jgi:predicted nucleic acid-binding protein
MGYRHCQVLLEYAGRLLKRGKLLAPLGMLIAAHALNFGVTLVTNNWAFRNVPNLRVDDWMIDTHVQPAG